MLIASPSQLHVVCSAPYLGRQLVLPSPGVDDTKMIWLFTHLTDLVANSLCAMMSEFPCLDSFSLHVSLGLRLKTGWKYPRRTQQLYQTPGYELILHTVFWHAPCSAAERAIMRSAKYYLSNSRAKELISPVIGQCYCLKAFKMCILADR